MTPIEQQLQEFEKRPAGFTDVEQQQRSLTYKHFSDINRFEGITPDSIDVKLFNLLIAGKISKSEYLELCLMDARGKIQ
jgi:hypothetical protein